MAPARKKSGKSPRSRVRKPIPPPPQTHVDEKQYRRAREDEKLRRERKRGG
ncbi:MAG: hypothetical protein IVW54_16425 [Candidatus Binataceae bacterium]|nr:hypothetical protein [Candidatus Binataceae bacterium]